MRTVGTPTGKFSAESVRGCKAEHILSEQTLEKIRERALLTDAESSCAAQNE